MHPRRGQTVVKNTDDIIKIEAKLLDYTARLFAKVDKYWKGEAKVHGSAGARRARRPEDEISGGSVGWENPKIRRREVFS
jgi:hypothetical protein